MPYYPKSQLKTNLYTNGGEYILSTTKEPYIGAYYKTASNIAYTGVSPQDGNNILLLKEPIREPNTISSQDIIYNIPVIDTQSISKEYFQLNPQKSTRTIPYFNPTFPTQQDQSVGIFQRYFCKKTNELKYLEIDKLTHDRLKSRNQNIAWDLYVPVSTPWYLKGEKKKIYNANKGLISLIEKEQKWYGFTQWFKDDFLKYYLEF